MDVDKMRPGDLLRRNVGEHVTQLQASFLAEVPSARARVAQLRQGVGRPAGSIPLIWEDTIEPLDPTLRGRGDDPSPAEVASHLAITMYAVHQQGTSLPMHRSGTGVGHAVRRLMASDAFSEKAIRRRFIALATAQSADEAAVHLRGLITQLRTQDIALDYGQLATDLHRLMRPQTAASVRLRWGRQLHIVIDKPSKDSPQSSTDESDADRT